MNNKSIQKVFESLQKEIKRRSPEQLDEYVEKRWGDKPCQYHPRSRNALRAKARQALQSKSRIEL